MAEIVDTGSDLIHSTVELWGQEQEEGDGGAATARSSSRPVASLVLTLKALAALERIVVD